MVEEIYEIRPEGTFLYLDLLLHAQNPGLNPDVLLQGFKLEYPDYNIIYSACHRKEILDDQKNPYR